MSLGGESPVSTAGLVVGLGASGAMLAVCAKRVADLEYNDGDWPGALGFGFNLDLDLEVSCLGTNWAGGWCCVRMQAP